MTQHVTLAVLGNGEAEMSAEPPEQRSNGRAVQLAGWQTANEREATAGKEIAAHGA